MKPKRDLFDRKLDALAKLRRTKEGRQIVEENRGAFLSILADAIGKP